jgi:GTP-binding protein HflX
MADRRSSSNTAILVSLDFGEPGFGESLEELVRLAESAGLRVLTAITGRRLRPDPTYFAGKGKVAEVAAAVSRYLAPLVIFNHEISPAQERNLEQAVKCRVIDRTSLILDIFAQRARSHEGKLQVELAQLGHLATRLIRGWAHLERQKGGIGLRGPGETQLETDRRLIAKRVKLLKEKLICLKRQRHTQRRARQRAQVLSVSIVGYTNAGKSTLFNNLTRSNNFAADRLFATLDTTSRRMHVGEGIAVVVSDTVGFIRKLPHTLVEAFRATLEETVQADVLLHVVDAASANKDSQIEEVNKVLQEIGARNIPQIVVLNKIDLTGIPVGFERDEYGKIKRVRASAATEQGLEWVRLALRETALGSVLETPLPQVAGA